MDHVFLDKSDALYEEWNDELKWVVIGAGMDATESYLPGQRMAPFVIRRAIRRKDAERKTNDAGNVVIVHGDVNESLLRIQDVSSFFVNRDYKPLLLGGEHTISYGVVKSLLGKYGKLQIVSLDAHYDAYDVYDTLKYAHATVMRRISELKHTTVVVLGARRWSNEEYAYAKKMFKKTINRNLPTYLSIDLDYFDPSIAPGVADKESQGYFFEDFLKILKKIDNLVGADIVELNPFLDVSEVTANLAADILLKVINK